MLPHPTLEILMRPTKFLDPRFEQVVWRTTLPAKPPHSLRVQLGLFAQDHLCCLVAIGSLLEGRVWRVMTPSPEYPAAPPTQLSATFACGLTSGSGERARAYTQGRTRGEVLSVKLWGSCHLCWLQTFYGLLLPITSHPLLS